ncbi:PAS domain-containing protein [Xanthocytophaga agilis]|uniref:PAS domain-containing protein n=1 Tax=Xanthocytophaga agilis TaxID=3048010 RepID=A0AAE3R5S2_9BACT|nr:PAS domain-containing protein [Xanthocytophaga agilis]MDJ1501924.1 PAS domain-containing protein [Xanthocytophaga agilis]
MLKHFNAGTKILLLLGFQAGLIVTYTAFFSGKSTALHKAGFILISLFLIFYIGYAIWKQWIEPLKQLDILTAKIVNQEADIEFQNLRGQENISGYLTAIHKDRNEVVKFVEEISHGNMEADILNLDRDKGIGKALLSMRAKLKEKADEEGRRNWEIAGSTLLGDELRKHQHLNLNQVSLHFLRQLIEYCRLNQGGVFLIQEEDEKKYIELTGCIAYNKQKFIEKRLQWGQGLVGQCILEKESIYIEEVPSHYVSITSGLGEATPRSILLVPIAYKEEVLGVVEVASFRKLQPHEIHFLETSCEIFGSVIYNAKINEHTQKLLTQTQKIAEELASKEEMMRNNAQELIATQEELNVQLRQIERQANLTQSMIEAINKTNASIELDREGTIISANEMYLSLMEYSREEIVGKKERQFVAMDELVSQRYEMMWDSIKNGSFNSGEFKRINKRGKELWLSGTYSPIFDIDGKLLKIVQLAQFTTEQREKEMEYIHKLNAMNQSIYCLELTYEGRVIYSNNVFQKEFGYKRSEITSRNFRDFLADPTKADVDIEHLCDATKNPMQNSVVLKFLTKDSREKYFVCSFSPIKNLSGEVSKILLIMIDFTRQHELQEEIGDILIKERREKAVLALNSAMVGAFADHFAGLVVDLENNYDYEDILYTLKGKEHTIPQLTVGKDGMIISINARAMDALGIPALTGNSMFIQDHLYFVCDEERQAFYESMGQASLKEIKLKVQEKDGTLTRFIAFIAPDFKDNRFSSSLVVFIHSDPNQQHSTD